MAADFTEKKYINYYVKNRVGAILLASRWGHSISYSFFTLLIVTIYAISSR
jgi:hypothetical protein